MMLPTSDVLALLTAILAIFMVGSTHLRLNIWLFALQTLLLASITWMYAIHRAEMQLYCIALILFALKTGVVPKFLLVIIRKVNVQRDSGTFVPAPISMHLSVGFLVTSYLLARQLPVPVGNSAGWPTATAAISLLCTGLVLMLTRRVALSQIIGFLVMENGIYLFGLTQTHGMPMLIEMGIMLDVLAGVMIAGLIIFRIKKNFEHIDVTMLAELKE